MRERKCHDGKNSVRCPKCGDILFKGKEAKEAELICKKCDTVFNMWMHDNALLLVELSRDSSEAVDCSVIRLINYGGIFSVTKNT